MGVFQHPDKEVNTIKGYVDLYLLPLWKKNIAAYRRQAQGFGRIAREYGALDYRDFFCDDLFPKGLVSFTRQVKLRRGVVLTAAIVGFRSRAHCNQVMNKVMNDLRVSDLMCEKPLFDVKKMVYGGFATFVNV